MMKGEFIAATPMYGYSKMDDGSWDIDPQAAEVIRCIFGFIKQGLSEVEIAERLSTDRQPMPREHLRMAKGDYIEPTCDWKAQNVRNILANIQYTGAYVSGRILTNADTGVKYRPPKDEWIIIPDKNPAIINQELYDEVQTIIANNKVSRRKNKQPRDYLLRSKVRCGCCDNAMTYDPLVEPVFRCYQTASDPSALCYKLKVVVSELDEAVLDIIRKQAEVILNTTDLTDLRKTSGNAQQIAECGKRLKSLMEQRQQYYEQFITGEIDRATHQKLKNDCTAQIERLNNQLATYRQSANDQQANQRTAEIAKSVMSESTSSKEVVDMLIDKIHVFPDNHLEITWKVSGFTQQ